MASQEEESVVACVGWGEEGRGCSKPMEGQSRVGLVELDCLELEGQGSLPTHLPVGVESTSMASGEQARGGATRSVLRLTPAISFAIAS
jgi:hypothetical protein